MRGVYGFRFGFSDLGLPGKWGVLGNLVSGMGSWDGVGGVSLASASSGGAWSVFPWVPSLVISLVIDGVDNRKIRNRE